MNKPKRNAYLSHASLFWWSFTRNKPISNHENFSEFYDLISSYLTLSPTSTTRKEEGASFLSSQNALNRQYQKLLFSFHSSNKIAASIFNSLPLDARGSTISPEKMCVPAETLNRVVKALRENYAEDGFDISEGSPALQTLRKNVNALLIHCKASAELSCISSLYIFLHSINAPLCVSNTRYNLFNEQQVSIECSPYQLFSSVRKQFRDRNTYVHQKQSKHIRWFHNIYTAMNPVLPLQQLSTEIAPCLTDADSKLIKKYSTRTSEYSLLLPIPMYKNFLESFASTTEVTKEKLAELSNLMYCNDPDREKKLKEFTISGKEVGSAVLALETICSPTPYYHYQAPRDISPKAHTQYKNALALLRTFLIPILSSDSKQSDLNVEPMTFEIAAHILNLLKSQHWIYYGDANLLGFWRITKYFPDSVCFDGYAPPACSISSAGVNRLLTHELVSLRIVCGVHPLPAFIPNPNTFQKATELRYLIYQNWDKSSPHDSKKSDTHRFFNYVIPLVYQHAYIQAQCDWYISSSDDIETCNQRIRAVSELSTLKDINEIDFEALLPDAYTEKLTLDLRSDAQKDIESYILSFLSKHNIDRKWVSDHSIDLDFILYHCFDECFLQASRVLISEFWSYLYKYADTLFPLQKAISQKKAKKATKNAEK